MDFLPGISYMELMRKSSLENAKDTLKGMGKTIWSNTPGPKQLAQGFRDTARGIWPIWVAIAFMLLFGEPISHWLTH